MSIETFDWIIRIIFTLYCLILFLQFVRTKQIPRDVVVWGIFGYVALEIFGLYAKIFLLNRLYEASDGVWKYYSLSHSDALYESFTNSMERLGISAILGLAVFIVFFVIARLSRARIVDIEDTLLLTLGALASGWPNFILFIGVVFVLTVAIKIIRVALKKESLRDRIIITPAIPLALIVMVYLGSLLAEWTQLSAIR